MAELGFASKEQVRAAPYTIIDTYGRRAAAQNMAVSCNHLCANPWLALPAAWYFCVSQTPHVLLRTLRSRVCGVRHDSCVQLAGWKVTIVGPRMGKQLTGVRVLGSAPAPCCSNVLQHVLGSRLPAHFSIRRFIIDDMETSIGRVGAIQSGSWAMAVSIASSRCDSEATPPCPPRSRLSSPNRRLPCRPCRNDTQIELAYTDAKQIGAKCSCLSRDVAACARLLRRSDSVGPANSLTLVPRPACPHARQLPPVSCAQVSILHPANAHACLCMHETKALMRLFASAETRLGARHAF